MSFNKEKYLEIRSRAKELLERRGRTDMPEDWKDITKLFEELEVSQIELELQNDELLRYQQELIESRNRYSNLYDLAPIGYVTLDAESRVVEMNLTGATMFGLDRGSMTGKPLTRFIAPESQDTFYLKVRAII
ncbi:MAG: PAS domain S-box protein, partial [Gammaproteobacteria bacterium]|nr:PAS domain S-box protein [Gammaproteobacteria bacterium]